VVHEVYDGKTKCVVDFESTDEARGVFFGYAPEPPAGSATKPASAKAAPEAPADDDDIPF
jgi:hypothetical protein